MSSNRNLHLFKLLIMLGLFLVFAACQTTVVLTSTKKTAELKKSANRKSDTVENKEQTSAPDPQKLPVSEKKDAEN